MSVVDMLKEMAVRSWGCPPDQVDSLWEQHVAWCEDNDVGTYGGQPWRALIQKARDQGFVPVMPSPGRQRAERAAEDARRRALDAQAYERAAESFASFLGRMRAKRDRGEVLDPHTTRLLERSDELSGSVSLVEIMAGVTKKGGA